MRAAPLATAVTMALVALSGGFPGFALAGPTGGQVTAGAATIQQSGTQTVVDQSTARAAINWQNFGIAANEAVIFRQPSSSAVALNRVVGADPSHIFGTLQANGHVFLINPSGVLFGPGAQVDVAGLVASTLNISNNDFMAGRYVFSGGSGAGAVINHGTLRAANGGYIALLGKEVSNTGSISAANGTVALGAGESMTLDFHGDGLLSLKVNAAAAQAKIENKGEIHADGGAVLMSARAKDALLDTVLNVEGIVTAKGFTQRGGHIYLDGGSSGVTSVSGTLDASSTHAKGGEIRVLGDSVGLFDGAKLDASGDKGGGTVLVGGDFQGKNADIRNAQRTYVGPDATIKADAITEGDGGKVIVWADDRTTAYGTITARGGAGNGNGGFVEVSGKNTLVFDARVDAAAPNGATGTLLLDPSNFTISTNSNSDLQSGTDGQTTTFRSTEAPAPSNINVTTLTTTLANVNVVVTTASNELESGNITVEAPIAWSSGRSLTLTADNAISVNASISGAGAALNLNAGSGGIVGGGAISVNTLNLTSRGNIALTGSVTAPGTTSITASGASGISAMLTNAANNFGTVTLGSSGDGTLSAVGLTDSSGIVLGGAATHLGVTAAGNISQSGALTVPGTTTLTSSTNQIGVVLTDAANNFGTVTLSTAIGGTFNNVSLTDASGITLGGLAIGGNLAVTANGAIAQTGALTVAGTSNFAAGAGSITLTNTNNNFGGAVAVSNSGANDIVLVDTDSLILNGSTFGRSLTATAGAGSATGDITLAAGQALTKNTSTSGATLRLNASRSISVNSGVTIKSGTGVFVGLGIVLNADSDMNDTGRVELLGSSPSRISFESNGGTIALGGRNNPFAAAATGDTTNPNGVNVSFATLDAAGGSVSLFGKGGASPGGSNVGVRLNNATITSGGGVTVNGTGGAVGTGNQGVLMNAGSIATTGSGAVNLTGTGGAGSDFNRGIRLLDGASISSSSSGSINLTGTGGGSGVLNVGIEVGSGSKIKSTFLGGHINLIGTGAAGTDFNVGIAISDSFPVSTPTITSSTGAISLSGTGRGSGIGNRGVEISSNAVVSTTNSVELSITGTGANDAAGIVTASGSGLTSEGGITLTADRMAIGGNVNAGSGTATLRPLTAGRLIDLGSTTDTAANTLELSDAELDRITAGTLRIGAKSGLFGAASSAGDITLSSAISPASVTDLHLITGGSVSGGNHLVTVSGLAVSAGGDVFLSKTTVDRVAVAATDAFVWNSGPLAIAAIDGVNGVNVTNAAFALTSGDLSQTAPVIASGYLGVEALAGAIALQNSANDVATLQLSGTGAVTYRDATGFEIAARTIDVNGTSIGPPSFTGGTTVFLHAGGAIMQGSAVQATALGVRAGGTVDLDVSGVTNTVTTVAIDAPNQIVEFRNGGSTALTIGSVADPDGAGALAQITGVTAGSANITSGGALTVDAPIITTPGVAGAAGGSVSLTGLLTTSGSGTITTSGAAGADGAPGIAGGAGGAAGDVLLNGSSVSLGAAIVANGGAGGQGGAGANGGSGGAGGIVTALAPNGTLQTHNITARGGAAGAGAVPGAPGADGTIQFDSQFGITQVASTALSAGSLKADNFTGAIVLDESGNDVTTLAIASGSGSVSYTDANAVAIGSVGAITSLGQTLGALSGITTNGGAVTVTAGSSLAIDQAIVTTPSATNTAGGAVTLTAGTAITSAATSGTITTTGSVSASGGSDTGGAGGEVLLHSTGGPITLNAGITASGGGAVEDADAGGAGGVITLRADNGNITAHDITTRGGAAAFPAAGWGGLIQLRTGSAGNTIAQQAETALRAGGADLGFSDGGLKVSATGAVTLTNAANDVERLAATLTDNGAGFSYTTSVFSNLEIQGMFATGTGAANIPAMNGITTNGGAVTVNVGGFLTLNRSIIATTPTATNTAGGAVFLTGRRVVLWRNATITTTGSPSANDTAPGSAGAGGEVLLRATSSGLFSTADAKIVASGGASVEAGDTAGAGGVVTLHAAGISSNIVVGDITADGGAPGGGSAGAGGAIQLVTETAGATITQEAGTALLARGGVIGANDGSLKVNAAGAVTLTEADNDVGTLAANVSGAGAAFSYTDATSVAVGTVAAAGTGAASTAALSGITTNNGNVLIQSAGTLAVQNTVNAAGASTTTLATSAGGNIVLNAAVGNAGGATALTSSGNISGAGLIRGDLLSLSAANGITANTQATTLFVDNTSAGDVSVEEADSVTLAGTFRNQAVGGALSLTASGAIDTSTATVSSNNGVITLTSNDAADSQVTLTVGTGGVSSSDADINLRSADHVAIGGSVNAGTGNATIEANSTSASEPAADGLGAILWSFGEVRGDTVNLRAATGIASSAGALEGVNTNANTLAVVNTTSGDANVYNTDGDASVSGTNTGGGAFNVSALGGTLTVGNLNANTGGVTLAADEMVLTGTINADAGVTLRPLAADRPITLGVGTDGLDFSQAALDRITTLILAIRSPGAGSIMIDAPIAGSTWGALVLQTATGFIAAGNPADPFHLKVTSLGLISAAGVGGAGNPLKTEVSNLGFLNTGAGGVTISNKGALTIVDAPGVPAGAGSSAGSGGLNLTVGSPLTIAANINDIADITLTAGETAGAGDDLTVNSGITITSTGGNVTLQAGDNVVLGSGSRVEATAATKTVSIVAGFGDTDTDTGVGVGAAITGTGTAAAENVVLDALTGIGTSVARVRTEASTLAARTTVSGGVFIENSAVPVTLQDNGSVANGTVGGGAFDIFSSAAITVTNDIITSGTDVPFGSGVGNGGNGGAISLSAPAITLGANLASRGGHADADGNGGNAGSITLTGPVVLTADVTLDASSGFGGIDSGTDGAGGNVVYTGTLNSEALQGYSLMTSTAGITSGVTRFGGAVGAAVDGELGELTVFGPAEINGGSIRTLDTQSYEGAVALGSDTLLTVSGPTGAILFGGTVESATPRALTVSAPDVVLFGGDVGGNSRPLLSLTVDDPAASSATIFAGGLAVPELSTSITTTTTQTYNAPVEVLTDASFTSAGAGAAGNIMFASTLDTGFPSPGPANVMVRTAGTTTFGAEVGFNGLQSLTVAGVSGPDSGPIRINADSIFTFGSQTYGGAVTLGNDVIIGCGCGLSGDVTFLSTIDSAAVAPPWSLFVTASGSATFSGSIGATQPLALLEVQSPSIVFDAPTAQVVKVTGPGPFGDSVSLYGDFFTPEPAVITLGQNLSVDGGSGFVVFGGTIDGARTLTSTSSAGTIFLGNVGAGTPLTSITTQGGGSDGFGGVFPDPVAINTSGAQTYNNAVLLASDTTFTSTGAGASGNITFASTLDGFGPASLTVRTAGTTTFGDDIGVGFFPLLSLTVEGIGGAGSASGPIRIDAGAIFTDGSQTYGGAVTLGNNLFIDACGCTPGTVAFASTIDGDGVLGRSLTLLIGSGSTAVFSGDIGSSQPLSALDVSSPLVTFDAAVAQVVTTTGKQTYGGSAGDLVAVAAPTLTLSAGEFEFKGGADSVSGAGTTIVFQPFDAAASFGVGGGSVFLPSASIDALADGFSSIVIGRADGSGMATVLASTFKDPLIVRSTGAAGDVTVSGALTGFDGVSLLAGDLLAINAPVVTTPASGNGGPIIVEGSNVLFGPGGTLDSSGAGAGNAGEIFIHRLGTSSGNLVIGQNVSALGGATGGNGGVVTVINEDGIVDIQATIDVSRVNTSGADGTIQLKASGNVRSLGAGLLRGNTDGKLIAHSTGGSVELDPDPASGHEMATIALRSDDTTGEGRAAYHDRDALTIGTVGGVGTLAGYSGANAASVALLSGVRSIRGGAGTFAGSQIAIRAGRSADGALQVDQPVDATPLAAAMNGGLIVLEGRGGVAVNAPVSANGTGNSFGGAIFIHNVAAAAGDITIDADLSARGGAAGGSGGAVAVVNDNGAIALNATIDVTRGGVPLPFETGDGGIGLKATGDITDDDASGLLKANRGGRLQAWSTGGSIVLDRTLGHELATIFLRTDTTAGPGVITYHDRDDVALFALPFGTILVGTAFDAPAGSATIQTVAGGADGAVSIRAGKSATGSLRIEAVGPGLLGIDTRSSVAGRPGGSVVLEANGQGAGFVSGLSIGGPIDTSGNGNADAGEIFLHNVGAAGDITIAADVTLLGGAGGGRGGLLTVLNENGEVALAAGATIDVSRGDASGDDGAIQIEATGSIGGFPGAVSLLRGSTNGSLLAYSSGGSIGLAGVGQQMATIALVSDAGGIEYDASGSVAIGTAGGGGVLAGLDGRTASSVVARSGVRDGGLAGTPTVRVAAGFGGAGDLFVDAPVTTSAAHVFLEATAGTITLNAGVSAAGGGNTTFNGPVIVAVPLAIDSGTGTLTFNGSLTAGPNALALTGNEIDFNGGAASVSGASTLLLQPGAGSASIGLGGGAGTLDLSATDLGALAAGFSLVTIGGLADEGITTIGVAGSPAVAFRSPTLIRQGGAGRIELAGDITAADVPLTLDGILALTGNSTVAAGSGDVTFTRDIVGGFDLAVSSTGTTSFGGDVGSFSDPLATLTTDAGGSTRFAGTNQSQAVFTMGAQTYGDPVTLAPHTTFESSSGNVGFGSTLDGDAAGGVVTVRAATVTFSGNVGAFQPFGRFSVEADALVFNGASPQTLDVSATPVGSAGGALFDAPIVLEQSLTLNTGAYAVTFSRAIDGPGAFTLDSSGSVFFDAPVGEAAALASLTTNAGGMTAIGPVVVRTTGAQSFGDDVIVYGAGVTTFRTIAGGGVTFGGTLDGTDAGADSVAIDAGTASVVFGGAIGGDRPLASFDVSAGSISLQPLAATLRVNLTSDTMALGAIDAPGATVTLRNLTAGTAIELGGEPGPGLGLSSAELAGITAGTLRIGRTDAAASGAIEVVGDVAPNVADLHLISGAGVAGGGSIVVPALAIEAGGAVNLNGLLTNVGTLAAFAPGQSIVFGQLGAVSIGTVDGVTGVSAFAFDLEAGGIAQTAALTITGVSSFDADANAIVLMHAGNDFGGAVRLANGGANDVALADANDLAVAAAAVGRNLALTAGGTLTLPAIATPGTQTYTAVTTVLNGDVLASGLTVNGLTAINAPSVSTTGDQTYGDAVTVGANAVLESSGDVSFASTLDADAAANNRTLAINAPLGTVTFLGDIGAIQPFADFDVIAAPNTIVFGAALPQTVNVTGQGGNTATFTGGVRLDQDLTVNTGGATSNNVTFASAINGGAPGRALTLNAGSGNVSLADVGNLAPLGTLTTLSSLLALNGAASASQIFISANAVVAGPGGALNATLPFSGFAGDAALTLSGPASGGIFGTEAAPLAVNVPGLLVLSPNADNTLPIVWLRGAAAGKPQYEFYDSASHRPVYFNGRPPSAALIAPELDYEDLRRQAPELAFAGSDEAAAIDVRVAEPPVCTAASAEGAAALACETAAARE